MRKKFTLIYPLYKESMRRSEHQIGDTFNINIFPLGV